MQTHERRRTIPEHSPNPARTQRTPRLTNSALASLRTHRLVPDDLPASRIHGTDLHVHLHAAFGSSPVLPHSCTPVPGSGPRSPPRVQLAVLPARLRSSPSSRSLASFPTRHTYYLYIPCLILMLQYLYTVVSLPFPQA